MPMFNQGLIKFYLAEIKLRFMKLKPNSTLANVFTKVWSKSKLSMFNQHLLKFWPKTNLANVFGKF